MNDREELLKEIRQNQQNALLNEEKSNFYNYFKNRDFNMQVTVSLDDYKPDYHLNYEREQLFETLNNWISKEILRINGYQCLLFNEISTIDKGWYFYNDEKFGGSILARNDGLIFYNWHYDYGDLEKDFQSVLTSAHFSMLACFLHQFYSIIGYDGRIHIELNMNGIELCEFFPPRYYGHVRRSFNYTPNSIMPIKRIVSLESLPYQMMQFISDIFINILSKCFKFNRFEFHPEIANFIRNFLNQP